MQFPTNKILIKQVVEMLEAFTGFETKNKYQLMTEQGKKLYFAYEESTFWARFFARKRSLTMHIINDHKEEELRIIRPFYFFYQHAHVYSKDKHIGSIEQKKFFINPLYEIYDANHQLLYTCTRRLPKLWTFNIFEHGKQIGQVLKKWSGLGKEMFTDADTFVVDFGTTRHKELIVALAFMIDLGYFEAKKR